MTALPVKNDHRAVLAIALPMIVSNLSVPLLGMVDTAVMGHLDSPRYLAAVTVGATIFAILYTGLNFLRMGTTGIAAQSLGSGDTDALRRVLAQALASAWLLAGLILLFQIPVRAVGLTLIVPDTAVADLAGEYFDLRIWSAPATLANYAFIGWFLGLQQARSALWVMLAINLSNIVLDLVFVLGFDMAVRGVAAASVVAECAGLVTAALIARRLLRRHGVRWSWVGTFELQSLRRLWSVNANLLVRTLALMFSFAFLTARGARFGEVVLAANAILMNFQLLMAYALDGFAHAAEALVGRAIGARDDQRLRQIVRVCMQWSGGIAAFFCAVFAVSGTGLIHLLTDLPLVRATAGEYLPWLIAAPLISVWSFAYDGIFVGAVRAAEMRNSMLFSSFAIYIPAWYLLQPLGNHGLWLAFMIFMAARGASMHWLYLRRIAPASD